MANCNSYVVAVIFFCFLIKAVFSNCSSWLTTSFDQTVYKQGFHREIVSNISWEVESDCTKINCDLLLLYHIPHAMFVDLDQIKSHKGIKVVALGDVNNFDVEKPAHLSSEQNILVYPSIQKENKKSNGNLLLTLSTMLPVHWRYQQPTQDEYYTTVTLPHPTVFGRCQGTSSCKTILQQCFNKQTSMEYPCQHHDTLQKCDWFKLKQNLNDEDHYIFFHVPVGVKNHTYVVACVTIFFTSSASYLLLRLPWLDVNNIK